ncbi:ATP-binding protein [Kitasatospora sp. NPDC056783]|uniref:ATP-binding protein n=1 Tax=Kitasatospora sp. NPDC056783 TaxID=3345943 RepID=UPI00367E0489
MPEDLSPFSPAPTERSCWLPRRHDSPRAARWALHDFLRPHPSGELLVFTGELLVSELVTNAVQHCHAPLNHLILVRFDLSPEDTLRIEVHDTDPEEPTPSAATPTAETGRGLFLVQKLATQWGCCPRESGVGKFVWCHISPEAAAA